MSRLTYKKLNGEYSVAFSISNLINADSIIRNKLGKLEDILEEYGIEDLTDLKIALDYYNHRFDGLHTERVGNDE